MSSSPQSAESRSSSSGSQISARDFDRSRETRPPLRHASGASTPTGLLRDDESLLSNVVDGIIERDRRKIQARVGKYLSFGSAILSWYVAAALELPAEDED